MSQDRVALYLQDAHDLREGMKFAQYAEQKGFEAVWQAESRLVRDAIVPMAAFAAVTDAHQGRLRRHQQLDPQHRPAGGHLSHAGRPGAQPHHLRHRRLVGSAGAQRGHRAPQAAAGHARDDRGDAAAAAHGERHLPRRIPPCDRHRAGRGAWPARAAQRADHRSARPATR